jgi:hypothetical protein
MRRNQFYDGVTMAQVNSITSLPVSPVDERRGRMVKYSLAMALRLVCIGACFITPGWWLLLPATGAVVLPYLAVVVANQVDRRGQSATHYAPGALVPMTPKQ